MTTSPFPICRSGLDVLLSDGLPELSGARVGLITNQSAVDARYRGATECLIGQDDFVVVALLGPEHGLRHDAQAGDAVASTTDTRTGLPVYSLYGDTRRPTSDMLDGLDALIFDIQDVGVRYATYAATLAYAQEAAAAAGFPVIVLDRPNPINGTAVEGNTLDPAFASFVGIHPMPIRHGLTIGELARLFAAERGWPSPLIVPMTGWRRGYWFDDTGLPWVQPSPNLPTLDSLTLYAGTCLLEGTNVSEGRGTTRPFELIGAPWLDPPQLAENLENRHLPGVVFRPAFFMPTFSKHANATCGGVQIHVVDREALRPAALGLHLLHAILHLDPQSFRWTETDGTYFIDLLLGRDQPRLALDNDATAEEIAADWPTQATTFLERRQPYLLYHDRADAGTRGIGRLWGEGAWRIS